MGKNPCAKHCGLRMDSAAGDRKTEELVAGSSRLKAIKSKPEACLKKGQLYEAANLIASTIYGVGVRDLEKSRPNLRTSNCHFLALKLAVRSCSLHCLCTRARPHHKRGRRYSEMEQTIPQMINEDAARVLAVCCGAS